MTVKKTPDKWRKSQSQVARAQRAERILNDDLVKEAFERIDADLVAAWRETKSDDELGRYNAYLMQRLLRDLKFRFEKIIRDGEAARYDLNQMAQDERSKNV